MGSYKKLSTDTIEKTRPPMVVEELSRLLSRFQKKKKLPICMPDNPYSAAQWFISKQEQPSERDDPTPVEVDGEIIGWNAPYVDRLKYNLRIFLSMRPDQQSWIVDRISEGIPWRGDDIKFYAEVVKHHRAMMKNKSEFVGNAKKLLQEFRA